MATVSTRRPRLLLGLAPLTLLVLSCGGDDGSGPGPAVAIVEVSPAEAMIAPTETVQLAASPRDATGSLLTDRSVSWETSDPAVATVSEAGLVTGVSDGEAVITATVESESGSAAITVRTPVSVVEVTPQSAAILNGEELQLAATAKDAAGNPLSDRSATWSSDATDVATVSNTGTVTGVAPGTANITATVEGKTGAATITVSVLDVAGEWAFSETLSDPAINLACANEATVTLEQTDAAFNGTSDQTGECTLDGEPFDNSGTFEIADGTIQATTIAFTQPGQVECVYEGSLVDNPPISASGTVVCTGFLGFELLVNATGTWEMTR